MYSPSDARSSTISAGGWIWDPQRNSWYQFYEEYQAYLYSDGSPVVIDQSTTYGAPSIGATDTAPCTEAGVYEAVDTVEASGPDPGQALTSARARRDSTDSGYTSSASASSGESYWSNTELDSTHSDRRIRRSTMEDTVRKAPSRLQRHVTYPKKWREDPNLPTMNADGQTRTYPVSNSGFWERNTIPGPVRARYRTDKNLSTIDCVYHNPNDSENMSSSVYHSKSKGEPGLRSNGSLNIVPEDK